MQSKTLHFCIFGYKVYVFLSDEVCNNKFILCSELMIFIRYKDTGYCFMHHTQENVIFHSTHTIFNEEFFSKYTNSCVKEHKSYNKLLNKIYLV